MKKSTIGIDAEPPGPLKLWRKVQNAEPLLYKIEKYQEACIIDTEIFFWNSIAFIEEEGSCILKESKDFGFWEGEVNLKIRGCEEQNVLFTQKNKAQR